MKAVLSFLLILSPIFLLGGPVSKKTVIVRETFENKSRESAEFVNSLRERVLTEVEATGKFVVIDRSGMPQWQTELDLAESGLSDGKNSPQLGSLASAGYEIAGTILSIHFVFPETVRIEFALKIIDINTQTIVVTRKITARQIRNSELDSKEQLLDGALAVTAKEIVGALLEREFPPKILSVTETELAVNLPSDQTKIGDLFDVYSLGEELIDPDSGESLGCDEEKIGRVRIVRPGPKFSKAQPVGKQNTTKFKKGMILRRVTDEQISEEIRKKTPETKEDYGF